MTKSALLKGRSIGNPFLLAWILGMSVAYALIVLVCAAGVTSTNGGIVSLGVTACILGLSLWQSVLLLPTWRRRLGWMLICYFVSLAAIEPTGQAIWFRYGAVTAVIQAILLVEAAGMDLDIDRYYRLPYRDIQPEANDDPLSVSIQRGDTLCAVKLSPDVHSRIFRGGYNRSGRRRGILHAACRCRLANPS